MEETQEVLEDIMQICAEAMKGTINEAEKDQKISQCYDYAHSHLTTLKLREENPQRS